MELGLQLGEYPPRTLAQKGPRPEPTAPRGLDAPGHEAIQRIGPQAIFLPHFELGPGDDPPGLDVLPTVGAFVAVEVPDALPVGRSAHLAFICADMGAR